MHCTLGAFTLGALHTRSIAHRVHAHWVYSTLDASHTECSIHWAHCTQGTLPAMCATHAHSTRQGHCTLHALCTGPVSHSGSGGQSTAVARRRRGARRDLGFQGVLASSRETNKHTTTRYRVCWRVPHICSGACEGEELEFREWLGVLWRGCGVQVVTDLGPLAPVRRQPGVCKRKCNNPHVISKVW